MGESLKGLPGRLARVSVVVLVVALLGLASWWLVRQRAPSDPQELYYRALQTSLSQPGLTCTITETTSGAMAGTTRQAVSLDLRGGYDASATASVKQNNTTVTTEELTTKTDDYVRYTDIHSTAAGSNPKQLQPEALSLWSRQSLAGQASSLYGRTALGNCIVPLADLSGTRLAAVMTTVRQNKVFTTQFVASTTSTRDGVAIRTYAVTIPAVPYITFMKQAASAAGRHDLDSVKPADYTGKAAEHLRFIVDKRHGRLLRIEYAGGQRSIDFSNWGQVPELTIPKNTVTPQQLQDRLKTATGKQ